MLLHTDDRFSSESEPPSGFRERLLPRFARLLLDSMVFKDDPDHTRLRRLVNRAFTPKMVASMEERPAAILDHHVNARSEEHTSENKSLMRTSYAVFCSHKKQSLKTNSPAQKT